MLVVVVRVFPSHLRICNVIEVQNSAEIRGSGSKSETQIDLQIDQSWVVPLDRSADRSSREQRVGLCYGSVSRSIHMRTASTEAH